MKVWKDECDTAGALAVGAGGETAAEDDDEDADGGADEGAAEAAGCE